MAKKNSTKKWLKKHLSDKYVKLAAKDKLKSRAAYKLKQINDRYKIIKRGDVIIDLGAAPGGWSQIASETLRGAWLVICVDLLPVTGIPNVKSITSDVFGEETLTEIDALLHDNETPHADLLMSDMAPNLTGIASTDSARSYELVKRALFYAKRYLKTGSGVLIVKLFRNEHFKGLLKEVNAAFLSCQTYKPDASRSKSAEIYLIARKLKPTE